MPTLTWQAYNLRDIDGDGKGDSWYARWGHKTVLLGRPLHEPGRPEPLPPVRPALPALAELERPRGRLPRAGRPRVRSERRRAGEGLRPDRLPGPPRVRHRARVRRRRGLPRPGRQPHVPLREQLLLAGLEARATIVSKTKQWRDLGRPEAALLGVQYLGNDDGAHRGAWRLRKAPAGRVDLRAHRPEAGRHAGATAASRSTGRRRSRLAGRRCSPRSRTSSGRASRRR